MKKRFKSLLTKFHLLNKQEQRIIKWYLVSLGMIFAYTFINHQLDVRTYFRPFISIMMELFLLIDVFLIPFILVIKEILSETKNFISRFFQTILSITGLSIITIIIFFIFSLSNKSIINSNTVHISSEGNNLYIENTVWLESRNHIDVYQIEKIIFVKLIGSY